MSHQPRRIPTTRKPRHERISRATRADRRDAFAASLGPEWTRYSDSHFSRDFLGDRLDYWPGPQTIKWRGEKHHDDVEEFMARNRLEKRQDIDAFEEQARALAHAIPICDLGSREGVKAVASGLRGVREDTIREVADMVRLVRNDIPMTGEECANGILHRFGLLKPSN